MKKIAYFVVNTNLVEESLLLPAGTRIVGTSGPWEDKMEVTIEHPSFPLVEQGSPIPRIDVWYRRDEDGTIRSEFRTKEGS